MKKRWKNLREAGRHCTPGPCYQQGKPGSSLHAHLANPIVMEDVVKTIAQNLRR